MVFATKTTLPLVLAVQAFPRHDNGYVCVYLACPLRLRGPRCTVLSYERYATQCWTLQAIQELKSYAFIVTLFTQLVHPWWNLIQFPTAGCGRDMIHLNWGPGQVLINNFALRIEGFSDLPEAFYAESGSIIACHGIGSPKVLLTPYGQFGLLMRFF